MRNQGARSLSACGMVVLLVTVMLPASTPAQQRRAAERAGLEHRPLEYISTGDQRVIRKQVEVAITAAEMAVETLTGATTVEELTRAKDLSLQSYVLLRYAWHGVELITNAGDRTTSERLMARVALEAIMEARKHQITAQLALDNAIAWENGSEQFAEDALRDIEESIPPARKALLFIFR